MKFMRQMHDSQQESLKQEKKGQSRTSVVLIPHIRIFCPTMTICPATTRAFVWIVARFTIRWNTTAMNSKIGH